MKKATLAAALLLFIQLAAIAEDSPKPPLSVDEIVSRVQRNVAELEASLPDFLCDEHVTSQIVIKDKITKEVIADFAIRATREGQSKKGEKFAETRELRLVNGKPAESQEPGLPFKLNGGFSRPLSLFSPESRRCFDFSFVGTETSRDRSSLVLSAAVKNDAKSLGGDCEDRTPGITGRIWVDRESMQVVRLEPQKRHRKDLKPGALTVRGWSEDLIMSWSVEYSEVRLDGKAYWMPITVKSEVVSTKKPRRMVYRAEYSNYHKFGATTKVLSDVTEQTN